MQKITSSGREVFMDSIKGIAIFLVVVGHVIQTYVSGWEDHALFKIIYMFHMPLFMFISGRFAYGALLKYDFKQIVKRRFISLMVPSLTMGIVNAIVTVTSKLLVLKPIEYANLPNVVLRGLWFLTTLYVLYCIAAVIYRLARGAWFYVVWLVVFIAISFLPDVIIVNEVEFMLPFFVLGIITRKVHFETLPWWVIIIPSVVMTFCFQRWSMACTLYEMQGSCLDSQYFYYTALRWASGVSGILLTFYLVRVLKQITPAQIMALIVSMGSYTLPIYALHQKWMIHNFFTRVQFNSLLLLFIISIAVVLLSVYAYRLMKKNRLLALLFFGEQSELSHSRFSVSSKRTG